MAGAVIRPSERSHSTDQFCKALWTSDLAQRAIFGNNLCSHSALQALPTLIALPAQASPISQCPGAALLAIVPVLRGCGSSSVGGCNGVGGICRAALGAGAGGRGRQASRCAALLQRMRLGYCWRTLPSNAGFHPC
jgi:hypothetical protein